MMRVGLTGGIASGKSAVADELAALGAVIIDADRLAREVVEPGTPGLAAVVARFGPEVLTTVGSTDPGWPGSSSPTRRPARSSRPSSILPCARGRQSWSGSLR